MAIRKSPLLLRGSRPRRACSSDGVSPGLPRLIRGSSPLPPLPLPLFSLIPLQLRGRGSDQRKADMDRSPIDGLMGAMSRPTQSSPCSQMIS
eukprot:2625356-Rhodomonas_salina.1